MRIIFAIPGANFSREFMINWTRVLTYCISKGHDVIMSAHYSSMVHFARAKCLGYDVMRGENQKPFGGDVQYDVIICMDSDNMITPEHVQRLLDSPHDVTCGIYMMADNIHFATVKEWDLDYFRKNGTFQFLTVDDLPELQKDDYVPVAYSGLGCTAIKYGVLEKLKYPPFYRPLEVIPSNEEGRPDMIDMQSEDVCLFRNINDIGIKTYIDTHLRVGHQKLVVL